MKTKLVVISLLLFIPACVFAGDGDLKVAIDITKQDSIVFDKFDGGGNYSCTLQLLIVPIDTGWSGLLTDPSNWTVVIDNNDAKIGKINPATKSASIIKLSLPLNYQGGQLGKVFFRNSELAEFKIDTTLSKPSGWKWGNLKPVKLQVNRLALTNPVLTIDYAVKGDLLGHKAMNLHVESTGTFTNDSGAANGTTSSIGFSYQDFWIGNTWGVKRAYYFSVALSGVLETSQSSNGGVVTVRNQTAQFEGTAEIPYTNFLAYRHYSETQIVREVLPLRLGCNYLPKGTTPEGIGTPSRLEFTTYYELPFSKSFIFEWKSQQTLFDLNSNSTNTPSGNQTLVVTVEKASYNSFRIAQEFDAFAKTFGSLLPLLGDALQRGNNNFIYFEYANGRKPPNFEQLTEKKFGVSIYF